MPDRSEPGAGWGAWRARRRPKRHPDPSRSALVLQVTIEPGEPLAGSVRGGPAGQDLAFTGWIGLAEALDVVRRRAGHLDPPGTPPDQQPPT
ncbi:MAG: hypothetical protein ACYCUF_03305 [Acidimicrobiales bacterium]